MADVVVRYKVSQGRGDENQSLIEAVFAELDISRPDGFGYGSFRLEDGVTFVHIARVDEGADNPLGESKAFARFTAELGARCDEPPAPAGATLVGQYGLLA
jgi:hypothetical protein